MVEEQARIRLAEASLETERIRTNYLRDQYRKDRFDMMQNADWLKKERQIEDHMNKEHELQHVAYCINKENENQRSYKDKFVRFNVSDNLRGNNFEQKTIGGRLAEKPQENKIIPAGYKEVN